MIKQYNKVIIINVEIVRYNTIYCVKSLDWKKRIIISPKNPNKILHARIIIIIDIIVLFSFLLIPNYNNNLKFCQHLNLKKFVVNLLTIAPGQCPGRREHMFVFCERKNALACVSSWKEARKWKPCKWWAVKESNLYSAIL